MMRKSVVFVIADDLHGKPKHGPCWEFANAATKLLALLVDNGIQTMLLTATEFTAFCEKGEEVIKQTIFVHSSQCLVNLRPLLEVYGLQCAEDLIHQGIVVRYCHTSQCAELFEAFPRIVHLMPGDANSMSAVHKLRRLLQQQPIDNVAA